LQIFALEELGDETRAAIGGAKRVEQPHDVLGVYLAGGARLAFESREQSRITREIVVNHFDRVLTVDAEMLGLQRRSALSHTRVMRYATEHSPMSGSLAAVAFGARCSVARADAKMPGIAVAARRAGPRRDRLRVVDGGTHRPRRIVRIGIGIRERQIS
jgi:hypothetical protein